jgi:hypothetical protein
MPKPWRPGRRPGKDEDLPPFWRHLLNQAADGAGVVYGLMLLEERYPPQGPRRERVVQTLIEEARAAARAALVYLRQSGSVPHYLLDLRNDWESRERERGGYRDRARRAKLGLLPSEDRGWERKRALDRERYLQRMQSRAKPQAEPARFGTRRQSRIRAAAAEKQAASGLLEAAECLATGMAGLYLSCFPNPELRLALAPAVVPCHRLELTLIFHRIHSGMERFGAFQERVDEDEVDED